MRPIKTASSNHNFGPPVGKEGEIGDLPCEIVADPEGERYIYSVWEPNGAEREAIAAGQNVRLGVGWIGGFPPVSLSVTHATEAVEVDLDDKPRAKPQPDGGRVHG